MNLFLFALAALATELVLMGGCRKTPVPPIPVAKLLVLPPLPAEPEGPDYLDSGRGQAAFGLASREPVAISQQHQFFHGGSPLSDFLYRKGFRQIRSQSVDQRMDVSPAVWR